MKNRMTKIILKAAAVLSCILTLTSCDILLMALMMGMASEAPATTNTTPTYTVPTVPTTTHPFSNNTSSSNTSEEQMYRQQYQGWVKRFQENYKTYLDFKSKGSSWTGNYVILLRDEQRKMKSTREEARTKGYYIPQAPEETMNL